MCYHCGQKGHISKDCRAWKYGHHEIFEKAERAINGDGDDMMLCSLTKENKKTKESLVCRRCEIALGGWYDVHHRW